MRFELYCYNKYIQILVKRIARPPNYYIQKTQESVVLNSKYAKDTKKNETKKLFAQNMINFGDLTQQVPL